MPSLAEQIAGAKTPEERAEILIGLGRALKDAAQAVSEWDAPEERRTALEDALHPSTPKAGTLAFEIAPPTWASGRWRS